MLVCVCVCVCVFLLGKVKDEQEHVARDEGRTVDPPRPQRKRPFVGGVDTTTHHPIGSTSNKRAALSQQQNSSTVAGAADQLENKIIEEDGEADAKRAKKSVDITSGFVPNFVFLCARCDKIMFYLPDI